MATKQIHLIAIGGAIMHYLAIDLKKNGYQVTGSDDVIFDPAKSNLVSQLKQRVARYCLEEK